MASGYGYGGPATYGFPAGGQHQFLQEQPALHNQGNAFYGVPPVAFPCYTQGALMASSVVPFPRAELKGCYFCQKKFPETEISTVVWSQVRRFRGGFLWNTNLFCSGNGKQRRCRSGIEIFGMGSLVPLSFEFLKIHYWDKAREKLIVLLYNGYGIFSHLS